MKRSPWIFFSVLFSALIQFSIPAVSSDSSTEAISGNVKTPITLGIYAVSEKSKNEKYIYNFENLAVAISEYLNRKVDLIDFTNEKSFLEGIASGTIDFAFAADRELMAEIISQYRYLPFIAYERGGYRMKRMCLYVKDESDFFALSDVKARNAVTSLDTFSYYLLRDILDSEPEYYFYNLEFRESELSVIYSLALDQADCIFVSAQQVKLLKKLNPGAVMDIRPLFCSEPMYFLPVLQRTSMEHETVKRTIESVLTLRDRKDFAGRFGNISKMQIRFLRVTRNDYEYEMNLVKEAARRDWNADYRKYLGLGF